jgi:hypothetical protein
MLTDAQVIEEWKRRRSTTWQATRIAISIALISGGALWYLAGTAASDMSGTQLLATFLISCVLFVAAFVVIVRTNKLYRCPRCNDVPGYDGWPVNPERCSRCNAVLRNPH